MEKLFLALSLLLISVSVLSEPATTREPNGNGVIDSMKEITHAGVLKDSKVHGGQVSACEKCEDATLLLSDTKENAMNSTENGSGKDTSSGGVKKTQ